MFIQFISLFYISFGMFHCNALEDWFQSLENKVDQSQSLSVIKSLTAQSHLSCVHRCKLQTECKRINYNEETKQCELLKGTFYPNQISNFTKEENWIHSFSVTLHLKRFFSVLQHLADLDVSTN